MRNREVFIKKTVYVVLFFIAFVLGIVSFIEPWIQKDCDGKWVLLVAFIYLVFMAGVVRMCGRLADKTLKYLVWAGIAAAFCAQFFIAFQMKLIPDVDLSHIYDQATALIEAGQVKFTDQYYFGFFTNNIPIGIVVYWVFRLSDALGSTDYRLAGGVFNVCMLLLFYCFSYKVLCKITSVRNTAVVMAVLLTNPALYAYASYYYTDTVSMPFVMIGTYLILKGWESDESLRKKLLFYLLAGTVIGLALKIRVTSVFIALAFGVFLLWKRYWKEFLKFFAGMCAGSMIFFLLWSIPYHYHIDFDTKDTGVPVQHFLMMGSNNEKDGRYFHEDVKFTRSFETHEERVENNMAVWQKRIKEKGIVGNLVFMAKKEAIVWCIGSKGYRQYTKNVEEKTGVYQWISGSKSKLFQNYMQAYNGLMLFFIALGLLCAWKRDSRYMLIFAIFWAGALVFYILWEAHPRQSMSYAGILVMMFIPFIDKVYAA